MSPLLELQRRCYQAFVHGRTEALAPFVAPGPGILVYQNNALETFRKTLAAAFPAVARLVGETCFRTLSRDYMTAFPSRSGNLESFSASFPRLLDTRYGGSKYAWLADVARLEWAVEESLVAADAAPLSPHDFATVAPESAGALRLVFHPSCRLVKSPWPISTIWRANAGGTSDERIIDLDSGPESVLVSRGDAGVAMRTLTTADAGFVEALLDGASLGTACERVGSRFDPGPTLRRLLAWQSLSAFSLT